MMMNEYHAHHLTAKQNNSLRCFTVHASWTRWRQQLFALHSRREVELLEGERLLSAILLRRRSQNLIFQCWRNEASVQLREAKWVAVNRLCSTQNTLIRNAFGALRLRPLVRSTTYHHLTSLLMHWRQRQKLLLRTYWMAWKEKFLLKKARRSPVANHCS